MADLKRYAVDLDLWIYGETEEEAKSLTERIGSMSLNFEQSRVISSILERKKREQSKVKG